MNKYDRALAALEQTGVHSMKVFGQSMKPKIESGSLLTFHKTDDYQVGDVVLSRVKSRFIDAHQITKIDAEGRYMISNNRGRDNGWTKKIFARVVKVNGKPFGRALDEPT
jgi:SOS-response transcriptional repressor LexA